MANDSPAVAHMKLAMRLRALRAAAGMTIETVASELLVTTSTVSRAETGSRPPMVRTVRDLCRLYRATDAETAELMAATQTARRDDPWVLAPVLGRGDLYLSLEQSAASLTCFARDAIPALLRTADYDRALSRPYPQLREARQAVLEMIPARFLLDEAVLQRHPGHEVMAAQLGHVLDLAEAGAVVQVILFTASLISCPVANFTILDFAGELPPMVFSEREDGYRDHAGELGYFQHQADQLRDDALSPARSVKLIGEMRKSYLGG